MANRIPPPNPDSSRPSHAQRLQEARKIEKVREIDADEQARRFQKKMEHTDEEEEATAASEGKKQMQPSPFQTSFYRTEAPPSSDLNNGKVPNPSYSQPPNVNDFEAQGETFSPDNELPQSQAFWKQVDLPDQPIDQKPSLRSEHATEKHTSPDQPVTKKTPVERETKTAEKHPVKKTNEPHPFLEKSTSKDKLEPSPFGLPGKVTPSKEAIHLVKKKPEEPETEKTMGAKYWEFQPELEKKAIGPKGKEMDKALPSSPQGGPLEKTLNQQTQLESSQNVAPLFHPSSKESNEHESSRGPKTTIEIVPPALPGFSSTINPEATAAATAATPYLRPEAVPLFYQMVGTILVMTNQGVSTTEILLNNPAFAGSKFFGASIEIVKYSSAPDSVNIRLSGSNEAVTAFNQNIPGLMAAFQTGGFQFRVGRIEATYAIDKPVFSRKEGQESSSGDRSNKEQG